MVTEAWRHYNRRRTAAQAAAENPTLAAGELLVEGDTLGVKVGDGTTGYNTLPYVTPYRGDLTMQAPTYNSGGVSVTNGKIARTTHVKVPWSYTATAQPGSDPAIGTGFLVDWQATVDNNGGGLGALAQSGYFGPRGVYQIEGLLRYAQHESGVALSPVGYGDFLTVANTAGVARTMNSGQPLNVSRSLVADGATVTLLNFSEAPYCGAAFSDGSILASVDGGTIDGATNAAEIVGFTTHHGWIGNVSLHRYVHFRAEPSFLGFSPLAPNPVGQAHWSGAGNYDATSAATVNIDEEVGFVIDTFVVGDLKIGIDSAHPILAAEGFFGGRAASGNLVLGSTIHATRGRIQVRDLVDLITENKTNTSTTSPVGIAIGAGRTITLNDTAGGINAGNAFGAINMSPTLVFDADANAFGSGGANSWTGTLKNVSGEARSITPFIVFNAAPVVTADNAVVSGAGIIGYRTVATFNRIGTGSFAAGVPDYTGFLSAAVFDTGVAGDLCRHMEIQDASGAGTLTTQVGIEIPALAKATANIGIRNAAPYVATPIAQSFSVAGTTLSQAAEYVELTNTSAGSLTLSSVPTIADPPGANVEKNGKVVEYVNVGAQNIVLQDQATLAGSNLRLTATTVTLTPRDSIRFRYSVAVGDWVQVGNVVVVL
jgi:hypothetical protein